MEAYLSSRGELVGERLGEGPNPTPSTTLRINNPTNLTNPTNECNNGSMNGKYSRGFTLTELLIVLTLIMLLLLLIMINWKVQIDKSHDVLRKKDLNDIKRSFEEYYNDKNCYPPLTILTNCNGPELQPYLAAIPCDPDSKLPYKYVAMDDTIPPNLCLGFRVLAKLRDISDPDISRLGCNGITGCGFGAGFNYGVSAGGPVALPGFDPGAAPTPTPSPQPGQYACDPNGICNSYGDPVLSGCPVTYAADNCNNACDDPANRCLR